MRKILLILLCLCLSGCSRITLPEIPPYTTAAQEAGLWQPVILADTPECAFRVQSCDINAQGDFVCELVCHNRSDAAQMFSCEAWCIDGWQVRSFWGEEVAPGDEETFLVVIPAQVLAANMIGQPQSLTFDLRIFSQANLNQNYLITAHCTVYPSGKKPNHFSSEPLSWPGSARVLADNTGCTLVLTDFRQLQGFYEVDCLLENKTRQNMMFRISDPVFNGVQTDQVWTMQLAPGAKCAATIVFDLPETAGYMRWLEFDAQAYSSDEWFGRVWVQERFCLSVKGI